MHYTDTARLVSTSPPPWPLAERLASILCHESTILDTAAVRHAVWANPRTPPELLLPDAQILLGLVGTGVEHWQCRPPETQHDQVLQMSCDHRSRNYLPLPALFLGRVVTATPPGAVLVTQ